MTGNGLRRRLGGLWWGHTHTAASVGRKAAGSLATAPRTAEEAAGNSGRWRPPDQSMPFAGGCGPGGHGLERGLRSGLDRAQDAKKAFSQPSTPPTMAGAAGRDRPCSFSRREIKEMEGGKAAISSPRPSHS